MALAELAASLASCRVDSVRVLSRSAFHAGVADLGLCLDLDQLQTVLSSLCPTATFSRSLRNKSLVMRNGSVVGAQIFHGTGTTQLMGARSEPAWHLELFRKALLDFSGVVLLSQNRRRRRRAPKPALQPQQPVAMLPQPSLSGTKRAMDEGRSTDEETLLGERASTPEEEADAAWRALDLCSVDLLDNDDTLATQANKRSRVELSFVGETLDDSSLVLDLYEGLFGATRDEKCGDLVRSQSDILASFFD
mmetsp:Transcript_34914/g.81530  ORF Transcript_34914/g.81530 Transcript_34914/m.81530 type:complete len:250 (+) Transcript_34914:495-1244(+)